MNMPCVNANTSLWQHTSHSSAWGQQKRQRAQKLKRRSLCEKPEVSLNTPLRLVPWTVVRAATPMWRIHRRNPREIVVPIDQAPALCAEPGQRI